MSTETNETALAIVTSINAIEFFAPGGSKHPLESLRKQVLAEAEKLDISTLAGRKAIASLAYKIARTSTGLDDLGKELVEDWKSKAKIVDAERKYSRDFIAALKDEVRAPLTEWETADAKRVAALEFKVVTMAGLGVLSYGAGIEDIEARIAEVNSLDMTNMMEFTSRAELTEKTTRAFLATALAEAQRRAEEAAEMARLRAEAAERERRDREERIASEAREAERKRQEEERNRIEQEKFQAEARAKQAEEQRKAAEDQAVVEAAIEKRNHEEALARAEAERVGAAKRAEEEAAAAQERHRQALAKLESDRIEAERKAAQDAKEAQERAIEAERKTAADEAAKVQAETDARERNRKHTAKINGEVRDALVKNMQWEESDGPEEIAIMLVMAIAKGLIPHTKISY